MRVHFNSDYLGASEVSDALALVALAGGSDEVIEAVRFDDPADDQFGFLLPCELGGDGPEYYVDVLQLILAFGTVSALSLFAKGFLTRAGELVAERLFKPAAKPYRDSALERERARRANWRDMAEMELRARRETTGEETTPDVRSATYATWQAWSREPLERLEYRGTVYVTLFVEEREQIRRFELEYDPRRERVLVNAPFSRSTAQRFWEVAALEIALMLEDLNTGPDTEVEHWVDKARAERRGLVEVTRRALTRHFEPED